VAAALALACSKKPPTAQQPAAVSAPVNAIAPPLGPPTYWGSVASILEAHCTSCHAPNGIGPFPLGTYEQAKEHHHEIAEQVAEREMPPWLPETKTCNALRHSRALSDEELARIAQWAKDEAPEGDKKDYRSIAPREPYDKVEGDPDRAVTPAEAYAPKAPAVIGRGDDYHCFVLEPNLDKPAAVSALRVVPGASALVHHVILYEVRKDAVPKVEEKDASEPGPGYTCFGGIGVDPTMRGTSFEGGELHGFPAQMIAAWAPGGGATDVAGAPTALPAGTAIRLAPGSKLVLQVHYSLENWKKGMTDRTRVDMWFAKGEPRKQAVWIPLLEYDFRVPPNVGAEDPRAQAHAEVELPFPLEVRGVAGHMHLRGKAIRVDATPSDDSGAQCLLDIPRWEFGHQEAYWLADPIRVSKAGVSCAWDNRQQAQPSVNGRQRKTKELRWGEGTDDEMCLAFLYATL
jgi:mono/diheme cytochrome c family protein